MKRRRQRAKRPQAATARESDRAVRILSRALERLQQIEDPEAVIPILGEPDWVSNLAPVGRAFARLFLEEADSQRRAAPSRREKNDA